VSYPLIGRLSIAESSTIAENDTLSNVPPPPMQCLTVRFSLIAHLPAPVTFFSHRLTCPLPIRQTQHFPRLLHLARALPTQIPLGLPIDTPVPRLFPPLRLLQPLSATFHLPRRMRHQWRTVLPRVHRLKPAQPTQRDQAIRERGAEPAGAG